MKNLIIHCFLLFTIFFSINAGTPLRNSATSPQTSASKKLEKNRTLKGKIIGSDHEPIAYATLSLFNLKKEFLLGAISDDKGNFEFKGLSNEAFLLEIQFIGFQKVEKNIDLSDGNLNLGSITLAPDATSLDEVTVTAEKSQFEYRLDKKVFNVGKDLISAGGSALDVLSQVPSVAVDPSGAVSLRGNSGVQILINGKRSGLTMNNALEAVPVNTIEKVEVVTNPSARFDASGSAGIINIILKKAVGEGWNGQLGAQLGAPANHMILPGINYKSEKFTFFSNLRARYSDYNGLYTTKQEVTENGATTFLDQYEDEDRHDDGLSGYFGADYYIDKKHSVTLAYFRAQTKDSDTTFLNYDLSRADGFENKIVRRGGSVENRNYNQIEFNFTKKYDQKGKKFSIDFQNDFWNSNMDWNINSEGDLLSENIPVRLRTENEKASRDYMLKTDFEMPLTETAKMKFGAKGENRTVKNDFLAEAFSDANWSTFAGIDNDLNYGEKIAGAYVEFENSYKKIEYQIGLRGELTAIELDDVEGVFNDSKNYQNLFPSAFLSYKMDEKNTFQASYSRRINRPSLWNLYPFNEVTDFNRQQVGNPNLNPAFADALEVSYLAIRDKFTFNPTIYYRHTDNEFGGYLDRTEDEIFLYMPINLEQSDEIGLELSARYQPVKFASFNAEFNFFNFDEKGEYDGVNLDAKGNSWRVRGGGNFSFPKGIRLQANIDYRGPRSSAQAENFASHSLSFGLSKNFLNNRLSVNLRAFNVTDSQIWRSVSTGENFRVEASSRRYGARYSVGATYRINQSERARMRRQRRGNR